ncbi:hypothetical protein KBZ14_09555 [Synechococcus sp. HJ21-Hayes]|uniref:hypothetical protein n=1 Tax=Synechococcus sp. HJ21-Hayes TaxID=2823736 RepID=UPI0020CFA987|nr:hypothetical protein [Synechococcus sp. HJ21-Hayes]MCP9831566.1 hypothetical protein [Synechococcus sp. JJ3a-Johnson]MCP9853111.1 hypothetical protein [Synechococcus sp. HJ21-Hayes]
MKHARFVDPTKSELLAEISYYEDKEPGLSGRFLAAVQEATARALAHHARRLCYWHGRMDDR